MADKKLNLAEQIVSDATTGEKATIKWEKDKSKVNAKSDSLSALGERKTSLPTGVTAEADDDDSTADKIYINISCGGTETTKQVSVNKATKLMMVFL